MTIGETVRRAKRWLKIAAITVAGIAIVLAGAVIWTWKDRAELSDLPWPLADNIVEPGEPGEEGAAVTVTWFGVTTLLFDDGETQVLIDGFFTRLNPLQLLLGEVETDIAAVNYALANYHINRLAAIVPAHSHFDHAMDVGVVANRSTAVVLGSESTANIVRGADLPVDQYQILASGESRQFGDFTITLIVSEHAPLADGHKPAYPGLIEEPVIQPAPVSAWKEGESYSIVIAHPRGSTLVQGSAGFIHGNLDDIAVDVVMLGVGGLHSLGRNYAGQYWNETVRVTGARRVFPVHFDDFTLPFGEIGLFPHILDDPVAAAQWLLEFAANDEDAPVEVRRLPFGEQIVLY